MGLVLNNGGVGSKRMAEHGHLKCLTFVGSSPTTATNFMDSNEIKTLKSIVYECPYIGFQGGGISNDDNLPPAYRSLIYRVNKLASDALIKSGCVIEDRLKEKLFRYD